MAPHTTFSGLVAGPAHNVARHLATVLPTIARIAHAAFDPPLVSFYEDGSSDRTRELLLDFCARAPDHRTVLPLVQPTAEEHEQMKYGRVRIREARIAHARNQLLAYARAMRVDFYLALDVDEVNYVFDVAALSLILAQPRTAMGTQPWDGAAANQLVHYYDTYALRVNRDDEPCALRNRGQSSLSWPGGVCRCVNGRLNEWWHLPSAGQHRFAPTQPPMRVLSAFGGAAVYRLAALEGCGYAVGTPDCEHVSLHRCMAERNNGTLTLQPALLNRGMDGVLGLKGLARLFATTTAGTFCRAELGLATTAATAWAVVGVVAAARAKRRCARVFFALTVALCACALHALACPGRGADPTTDERDRYVSAVGSLLRLLALLAALSAALALAVACACKWLAGKLLWPLASVLPVADEGESAPLVTGGAEEGAWASRRQRSPVRTRPFPRGAQWLQCAGVLAAAILTLLHALPDRAGTRGMVSLLGLLERNAELGNVCARSAGLTINSVTTF